MNIRVRFRVTTELGQGRDRTRGRGGSRLVSGTFPGRRGTRIRGGDVRIKLELARVFSELVEAVRG